MVVRLTVRLLMTYLLGFRTCHPQVVFCRRLAVVWYKLAFDRVET